MDNNKKITIENSLKNDNKLNKLIKNQYVSKTDKPKKPFNRKSLLFILISILICGIVVMYFIFGKTDNETYKVGFSYSPRDITNIETNPPIDKMVNNVNNIGYFFSTWKIKSKSNNSKFFFIRIF